MFSVPDASSCTYKDLTFNVKHLYFILFLSINSLDGREEVNESLGNGLREKGSRLKPETTFLPVVPERNVTV